MTGLVEVAPRAGKRGVFWMLVPVALLTASTVGLGIMASIATHDPGFSLEKDYYARAVSWDTEQAQRAENVRLGWHVAVALEPGRGFAEVVARVSSATGAPLPGANVRAEAFANARAGDVRRLTFEDAGSGAYRARIATPRPGLWELRFEVEQGGRRFTEAVRVDVPKGGSP